MREGQSRVTKAIATVLIVSCCVVLTPQVSAFRPPQAALVETGDFHGDEVHARTGQRWLGLYVSGDGSKLVDVPVKVSRVRDPIEFDERDRTGKRIETPGNPGPLFLVRGVPGLRAGHVTTVPGSHTVLANRSDITLRLGVEVYRLWVSTADPFNSEVITNRDARLLLSVSGKRQELYSLKHSTYLNEPNWSLLWAGDLDGDGLLDLYLSLGAHYNVADRRLFLSSGAPRGRLVRNAARLRLTGC